VLSIGKWQILTPWSPNLWIDFNATWNIRLRPECHTTTNLVRVVLRGWSGQRGDLGFYPFLILHHACRSHFLTYLDDIYIKTRVSSQGSAFWRSQPKMGTRSPYPPKFEKFALQKPFLPQTRTKLGISGTKLHTQIGTWSRKYQILQWKIRLQVEICHIRQMHTAVCAAVLSRRKGWKCCKIAKISHPIGNWARGAQIWCQVLNCVLARPFPYSLQLK